MNWKLVQIIDKVSTWWWKCMSSGGQGHYHCLTNYPMSLRFILSEIFCSEATVSIEVKVEPLWVKGEENWLRSHDSYAYVLRFHVLLLFSGGRLRSLILALPGDLLIVFLYQTREVIPIFNVANLKIWRRVWILILCHENGVYMWWRWDEYLYTVTLTVRAVWSVVAVRT